MKKLKRIIKEKHIKLEDISNQPEKISQLMNDVGLITDDLK